MSENYDILNLYSMYTETAEKEISGMFRCFFGKFVILFYLRFEW